MVSTVRIPNNETPTRLSYPDYLNYLTSNVGATLEDLGPSSDPSLHIYGIRIGNLDGSKKTIGIQGAIHGNEWVTAYSVAKFAKLLLNKGSGSYGYEKVIRHMLLRYDFYIIPMLNPAGYVNDTRENANGVDCNRNYRALSQPETIISATKLGGLPRLRAVIDCHRWASQPYPGGYSPPNDNRYNAWWDGFVRDLQVVLRSGVSFGKSQSGDGTAVSYFWDLKNNPADPVFSVTLEGLGSAGDQMFFMVNAIMTFIGRLMQWEDHRHLHPLDRNNIL